MTTRGRPRRLIGEPWLFTMRWDDRGRRMLARLAKRRGLTMSDLVRALVAEALGKGDAA